jgi:hypothetical protein
LFATPPRTIFHRATTTAAQTTGTQIALPRPAGLESGDELVAAIHMQGPDSGAITPPAGWTLVARTGTGAAASDVQLATYIRRVTDPAAEPATYVFGFAGTNREAAGFVSAYKGVRQAVPVEAAAGRASGTGAVHNFPELSSLSPGALALWVAAGNGGAAVTWTPPAGSTERAEVSNASGVSLVGAESAVSAPGMLSVDFDEYAVASASVKGAAQTLVLAPDAAPGPSAYMVWRERFWGAERT